MTVSCPGHRLACKPAKSWMSARDDLQTRIVGGAPRSATPAGGEVVVERDAAGRWSSAEQPVDEMAADEAGAADDEGTLGHAYPVATV